MISRDWPFAFVERDLLRHRIGQIVRRKLGLKTERKETGYIISPEEGPKLSRLFEKYGVTGDDKDRLNVMNLLNIEEDGDMPSGPKEQPIIW